MIRAGTFVRLAVSILLSTVIWGFIVWETNPEVTREFGNIAVTATNLPPDMFVVGGLPSISVTIKGPQDVVEDLVPSDLNAAVDFSDVERPGIDEYDVEIDAPSGVRRIEAEPSAIEVELDLIVTRAFPLELMETGERPPSLTSIEISAELASAQGPQELIDQISAMVLPVNLENRQESFTENVTVRAVAEDGSPVEGIDISPTSVQLAVTFEQTSRDVPVVVICACIVDDGVEEVELVTAAAIPSTIRLSGPSSALTEVSEVRTRAIDISSLDESGWILDVELDTFDLPTTVSLSDLTVDVWVPISPSRIELPDVPINVLGLGEGLTAELSEDGVLVVISGTDRSLIDPAALHLLAVVDLTGLETGTYILDVGLVVPPGVSWEQVEPETVQVVIRSVSTTANRLRDAALEPQDGVR